MSDDSDQALLERYRRGNPAAFGELVARYQRPLYNAAFWILRSTEDAADVAQSVFLKVAEQIDAYDPRYKFFSWIYRIAINESLNLQRNRRREEPIAEDFDEPDGAAGGPESRLEQAELARRVQRALKTMSTNDRIVISLRHFSECNYEEIGQILDIDEKTVKSRLFEARRRLRDLLSDLR